MTNYNSDSEKNSAVFQISFFQNKSDAVAKPRALTWPDVCAAIERPLIRREKDGRLWTFATFANNKRANANVIELAALQLDYDHDADFDRDVTVWIQRGIAVAAYTTHSHLRAPDYAQKFRVILPLASPIPAADYPYLWAWAQTVAPNIDAATRDASRIFYIPARAANDDSAPYQFRLADGAPLDWRPIVADAKQREASTPTVTAHRSAPLAAPAAVADNSRPGDDYNLRGDVDGLLDAHGWERVKLDGKGSLWRRPGKRDGHSARLFSDNHFFVFSSSAPPFAIKKRTSPFAVYALLNHGGDFTAAAKALKAEGYGQQEEPETKIEIEADETGAAPVVDLAAFNQAIRSKKGIATVNAATNAVLTAWGFSSQSRHFAQAIIGEALRANPGSDGEFGLALATLGGVLWPVDPALRGDDLRKRLASVKRQAQRALQAFLAEQESLDAGTFLQYTEGRLVSLPTGEKEKISSTFRVPGLAVIQHAIACYQSEFGRKRSGMKRAAQKALAAYQVQPQIRQKVTNRRQPDLRQVYRKSAISYAQKFAAEFPDKRSALIQLAEEIARLSVADFSDDSISLPWADNSLTNIDLAARRNQDFCEKGGDKSVRPFWDVFSAESSDSGEGCPPYKLSIPEGGQGDDENVEMHDFAA